MKPLRVGLNGFGRIGRAFTRIALQRKSFTIEAINTSKTDPKQLAYFLQYDSVYRTYEKQVKTLNDGIDIEGHKITSYLVRDPNEIPWDKHNIDIVIDCTGVFKVREDLKKHLRGSVKKVIMTAPSKDGSIPHVVLGANDDTFDFKGADIMSNASCTTNCAAVMMKVLDKSVGVEQAYLSTIHAYTSSQALVDSATDKFTRGRSAGLSIIPTTTGAADAVCKVGAFEEGRLGAIAIRVPTPVGSISDISAITKKKTTTEEINTIFKEASSGRLKGILGYEETPLVSSDYIGSPYSCIFDPNYTNVLNGNFIKIFGWYDNEWGYSTRLVDLVEKLGGYI
ncbi:hypothetical protein A3H80_03230 [Candidatus Roizmanbacteria bacterium RIFCSPLOWO2_02_FULL_37_19]|uniref:Glyceraldehyde 3-phosphate dehydrogenase NAD(P) binding domain-containing protein n=1 Tax=Candidatus Roizmanbacteria bacterium RIFCSPHIGHO2_02_FULL_37_24 TaxID=1802037 RepID=A0A1F7H1X1_9BACT|nr:MAG: hypothetical protein A2862_04260 [Candidatus Roizmanbacteria bacterium RIFCSPHIGHO2_01_FULL_38_41]OGK24702.1 MAG: hypothetical protein A3C24_01095 [Candidatus Roizmanbacteria bacterium RIFCSPHIGHO2_02_FULL_37_24]OGK33221.1 MAG: hypothetical protein A3E10_03695 [Candidatus Roizmanbacteria bacterium RIFCSPHIGHO2_12_FULL_37_23]OGK44093.1 MAG: hypothetical protein A2956_03520 [Candidatus Roizmanbacteria bacterium RIFCSPLOWO2_01_FULL_37_57]OGK54103.1 MAG: hypothetical protein A3H80_03230 [Ca